MGVPLGTNICVVKGGMMLFVRYKQTDYGYHMAIDHGKGFVTMYAHCSEILVTEGQRVEAEDVIAKSASTENSTGRTYIFVPHPERYPAESKELFEMKLSAKEGTMMNTKAIYTIRENLKDSFFYTEFAGGYSFPFAVAKNLFAAKETIQHLCGFRQVSMTNLMGLIIGDDKRLPFDAHGERLFIPLTETEAKSYLEWFEYAADIPFHITLDVNMRMAGFKFNSHCENHLPDLCFPMYGEIDYCGTAFWKYAGNYKIAQILEGRPVGDSQIAIQVQEEGFRHCFQEYVHRMYGESLGFDPKLCSSQKPEAASNMGIRL